MMQFSSHFIFAGVTCPSLYLCDKVVGKRFILHFGQLHPRLKDSFVGLVKYIPVEKIIFVGQSHPRFSCAVLYVGWFQVSLDGVERFEKSLSFAIF